jgi:hypothetical protein
MIWSRAMASGSLQLAIQSVGRRRYSLVGSGAVLSIQYECGTVVSTSAAGASPLLYGSVEGGVCSSPTRVGKREDKEGQLVLYPSATQDNMAHMGPDNSAKSAAIWHSSKAHGRHYCHSACFHFGTKPWSERSDRVTRVL